MNQEKIWDYFQNEGVDAFSDSKVRLGFLFRKALRIARGKRLRVLNIGAGNGWMERQCLEVGWKTYSLDPNESTIENLLRQGVLGKVGFIESIPFDTDVFDVVFCSEVLEHLSDRQLESGLNEISRVLVNTGFLIGSVPYMENLSTNITVCPGCGKIFNRWGHLQTFDKRRIQIVLRGGNLVTSEMGKYAFLDFRKGTLRNKVGLMLHWGLGKMGLAIASPSLYFVARKSST